MNEKERCINCLGTGIVRGKECPMCVDDSQFSETMNEKEMKPPVEYIDTYEQLIFEEGWYTALKLAKEKFMPSFYRNIVKEKNEEISRLRKQKEDILLLFQKKKDMLDEAAKQISRLQEQHSTWLAVCCSKCFDKFNEKEVI